MSEINEKKSIRDIPFRNFNLGDRVVSLTGRFGHINSVFPNGRILFLWDNGETSDSTIEDHKFCEVEYLGNKPFPKKVKSKYSYSYRTSCYLAGLFLYCITLSYGWVWFVISIFPSLPVLSVIQIFVLKMFFNVFKQTGWIISDEIKRKQGKMDPIVSPLLYLILWGIWYLLHLILIYT